MAIPKPIMNLFVGRIKEEEQEEEEEEHEGVGSCQLLCQPGHLGDSDRGPSNPQAWSTCCSPLIQSEEVDLVSYAPGCPHLLLRVLHYCGAAACRRSCWLAIQADGRLLRVMCWGGALLRVLQFSLLLGGSHSALPPRKGWGLLLSFCVACCLLPRVPRCGVC